VKEHITVKLHMQWQKYCNCVWNTYN